MSQLNSKASTIFQEWLVAKINGGAGPENF